VADDLALSGNWPSEVSWTIFDDSWNDILSGGADETVETDTCTMSYSMSMGMMSMSYSMDMMSMSYSMDMMSMSYSMDMMSMSYSMDMMSMSYSMMCDDDEDMYTLEMYDSFGDGWNSVCAALSHGVVPDPSG